VISEKRLASAWWSVNILSFRFGNFSILILNTPRSFTTTESDCNARAEEWRDA
jgi:hypothetical protein